MGSRSEPHSVATRSRLASVVGAVLLVSTVAIVVGPTSRAVGRPARHGDQLHVAAHRGSGRTRGRRRRDGLVHQLDRQLDRATGTQRHVLGHSVADVSRPVLWQHRCDGEPRCNGQVPGRDDRLHPTRRRFHGGPVHCRQSGNRQHHDRLPPADLWFTNEESTTVSRRSASGEIDTFSTDLAIPSDHSRARRPRHYTAWSRFFVGNQLVWEGAVSAASRRPARTRSSVHDARPERRRHRT